MDFVRPPAPDVRAHRWRLHAVLRRAPRPCVRRRETRSVWRRKCSFQQGRCKLQRLREGELRGSGIAIDYEAAARATVSCTGFAGASGATFGSARSGTAGAPGSSTRYRRTSGRPGYEGVLPREPHVHAGVRRGLLRGGLRPTACWTICLGATSEALAGGRRATARARVLRRARGAAREQRGYSSRRRRSRRTRSSSRGRSRRPSSSTARGWWT